MALGYCMTCDKLVPIRAGEQKWGSRECEWYPITHDAPDGKPCTDGPKKPIRTTNSRAGL